MRKILTVATNSDPTLHYGKTGLWLSELTHFSDVFSQAGFIVDVASPKGGVIPLDTHSTTEKQLADEANVRFLADERLAASLKDSLAVADADCEAYEAIYLAGGHGTMWDFRASPELQAAITAFYSAGKVVSAVCHGVAGLVDSVDADGARIIAGKAITGFSNMEDRLARTLKEMPFRLEDALKEAGADYKKNWVPFTSRVEVAGNVFTGQNPQSAKALAERVLAAL